ncbi:MAG: hypothetical protein ABI969_13370 [bacterium]
MPTSVNREFLRRLRLPAYAFLGSTLVFQIADFVLGLVPFQFELITWRFASLGTCANIVGNVLLLILLIYAMSLMSADRPAMLIVGVLSLLSAVFLLGATGVFALDAIQLRSKVEPTGLQVFDFGTSQAVVKLFIEGILSALFAFSALRSMVINQRETAREERSSDVLVGSRAALRTP